MATSVQTSKTGYSQRNSVYLTPQGLQDAKIELQFLKTTKRSQFASRLQNAREMDNPEENAEYDAAMTEQDMVENKISELERLIRMAKIIDHSAADKDIVTIGTTVRVEMIQNQEKDEFTLVGRTEANPVKKRISNESPLGAALLGAKIGETVQVQTPILSYSCKIIEIK
jgi:transcription elongation factor GreA